MSLRTCRKCNGAGFIYAPRVEAKDPVTFVFMVIDSFLPGGKKVRCPRCKGRGTYNAIKTNYRG